MSIGNEQMEMQPIQDQNIADYDENRNNISQLSGSLEDYSTKTGNNLLDVIFLRDESGRKQINRVCCVKIQKHWTIRMQMIVSLMVLSLSVFALVIGIVVGNLMLTRFLISKSSEEAIQQQIQENLKNSAQEYSNAIFEIFHGYSSTLEIMNKIILSALKRDDTLFDFDYVKEFPVRGRGQYFTVKDQTPTSMILNTTDTTSIFPGTNITLKVWQYGAYSYSGQQDLTARTSEGQAILAACDILNYILEDFYYDKSVTNIHLIYFAFETEKLLLVFPGGAVYGLTSFSPQDRPWYKKTKEYFDKYSEQKDLQRAGEMVITGPYFDQVTQLKTLTISKAIIDKSGLFLGVSSIDILVNDLQSTIQRVKFYQNGYLMLIDTEQGYILNQPYPVNQTYKIYDSQITHLDMSIWQKIQDHSKQNSNSNNNNNNDDNDYLQVENTQGEQMLLMINVVNTQIEKQSFMLLVEVPEREAFHFLYELTSMMEDTFIKIQWITVIIICCTCALAIVSGCFYSNKIVKPLTKLTLYARSINSNATKKNLAQDIKQDLDQIKAHDKIGELIDAFKNLVRGLSGLKKGARSEFAAGNEKISFPVNFYQNQQMKWRKQLDQLKNFELDKLLQNEQVSQPISSNGLINAGQSNGEKSSNQQPDLSYLSELNLASLKGYTQEQNQQNIGSPNLSNQDQERNTVKQNKMRDKNIRDIIINAQKEILSKLLPSKEYEVK